jgi:hypothetical protein
MSTVLGPVMRRSSIVRLGSLGLPQAAIERGAMAATSASAVFGTVERVKRADAIQFKLTPLRCADKVSQRRIVDCEGGEVNRATLVGNETLFNSAGTIGEL